LGKGMDRGDPEKEEDQRQRGKDKEGSEQASR
jgi:hypothetical protein